MEVEPQCNILNKQSVILNNQRTFDFEISFNDNPFRFIRNNGYLFYLTKMTQRNIVTGYNGKCGGMVQHDNINKLITLLLKIKFPSRSNIEEKYTEKYNLFHLIIDKIVLNEEPSPSMIPRQGKPATAALEMDISLLNPNYTTYDSSNSAKQMPKLHLARARPSFIIQVDITELPGFILSQSKQTNEPCKIVKQAADCPNNYTAITSIHHTYKSSDPLELASSYPQKRSSKLNCYYHIIYILKVLYDMYYDCLIFKSKSVVSFCKRDWHVNNISQGLLLTHLLKNCNVTTVIVMKKFFFVIIRSDTPNHTMELNFKFPYAITEYYMKIFKEYPFNSSQWKFKRPNIYKSNNTNTALIQCDNTTINNNTNNIGVKTMKTGESEVKMSITNSSYYESDTTIKNVTSDRSINDYGTLFNVEPYNMESFTSIDMNAKDSIETLMLSIEDFHSFHDIFIEARKTNGFINIPDITLQKRDNVYDTMLQNSKMWLWKLFNESINLPSFDLPISYDIINEAIFDKLTFSEYFKGLEQYWSQLNPEIFCKVFLKSLGKSIIYTLFSSVNL